MNNTEDVRSWSAASTVNDVVRLYPPTLSVFRSFGIDSCCGGALSLTEAAARHGVELEVLETALERAIVAADGSR